MFENRSNPVSMAYDDMAKRELPQPHRTKAQKPLDLTHEGVPTRYNKPHETFLTFPSDIQVCVSKGFTPQTSFTYTNPNFVKISPAPSALTTASAATSVSIPATPSDELPADEVYDGYLQSILNDYGLQLSPGRSRIEEIEQSASESELRDDTEVATEILSEVKRIDAKSPVNEHSSSSTDSASATTYPGSKFRKITQCQKIATNSTQPKEEELQQPTVLPPLPELQPLDEPEVIAGPSSKKKRKVGLYMCDPFEDPDKEKKRLNAVNAYRNRVKNKKLTQDLREKNNKLEHVNIQCSKALKRITSEAKRLHLDIEEKVNERNSLEIELRKKESEVREQREKLALFRGHLDLIASSLDEDNPARKLISTLLNKLPYEGQK